MEEQKVRPKKEPMKVVLRVKPFTQKDKDNKEDQGNKWNMIDIDHYRLLL